MVTKAEIQSIDFAGNTCVVRMPYFESAAGGDKAIATAIFSNTPGTFNGYKVGDIVLVAFEDGQAQQPCVIGKLYLGMAEENKEARGTINAEALTSSSTNSLPLSTKLTSDLLDNTADSNAGANSFKTIKELAEAVQNNTNAIGIAGYQTYSLAEQVVGTWIDGKTIYRKVFEKTQTWLIAGDNNMFGSCGILASNVIKLDGIITYADNCYSILGYHNTEDVGLFIHADGNLGIHCNMDWRAVQKDMTIRIIVEYTKA